MVECTLEETGANPAQLEIEVTEYSAMLDKMNAIAAMKDLQAMGLHIKADDVGIDHHSDIDEVLAYPYDAIKLDEYFSKGLETDPAKQDRVCAIVDKAHAQGVAVVAERVDSAQKLEFFDHVAHCDGFQGWHFSPSVPADGVTWDLFNDVVAKGRL